MSEIVTHAYSNANRWMPVIVRGTLWMIIAMLTSVLANVDDFAKIEVMRWHDWVKFVGAPILEGAIALRLFMDQSISSHAKVLENGGSKV
jgi:hypothetical protein